MEENKVNIWSEAGLPGLILGAVSIAYLVLNSLMGGLAGTGIAAFLIGTLTFLVWAGKTFLCIWLFWFFQRKFSTAHGIKERKKIMSYGLAMAALSALLYSVFSLAYMLYINPEALNASFDLAMQQYAPMMDAATRESMENLRSDMPVATFIVNLLWCFLFGTILSAIFSSKLAPNSDNPFQDEQ